MKPSLNALNTKLNCQYNELNTQLLATNIQITYIIKKIQILEKQMSSSGTQPNLINPELEINKLHFITHLYQEKASLAEILKNNQALEMTLKSKILRVKTELKMLDNYLQHENSLQKARYQKAQTIMLDEWASRKGTSL